MPRALIDKDGMAALHPSFLEWNAFDLIREETPWQQRDIRMFGKAFKEPRLTAWYGPPYTYSNISWIQSPMSETLARIRDRLEEFTQFPFNAVLLNLYRDGSDSMGWHRDNEREMDASLIASISLGASRLFKMRNRETNEIVDILLEPGSLLLMKNMQERWDHSVPKTGKPVGERINLTFRRILTRN